MMVDAILAAALNLEGKKASGALFRVSFDPRPCGPLDKPEAGHPWVSHPRCMTPSAAPECGGGRRSSLRDLRRALIFFLAISFRFLLLRAWLRDLHYCFVRPPKACRLCSVKVPD